jgi:hypothetical protein
MIRKTFIVFNLFCAASMAAMAMAWLLFQTGAIDNPPEIIHPWWMTFLYVVGTIAFLYFLDEEKRFK